MHSRRDFFKQAAFMSGIAGLSGGLAESIAAAAAIEPEKGSSFLDAEHVVILMQENRSFDHAYGTLRGVRGFNDPRAITLPDGNPVWVQANAAGERYVPFRLNIKDTKSTWMGSLPHNWTDQTDARNGGKYDHWLRAKRPGTRAYAHMPLTLGYCTREDIPFYYALADAFTICDQHFCSSLTGTTPNRLHLWTGTIRAQPNPDSFAHVLNSDCEHGAWTSWPTFPERLEDHGISWKIYQNEVTIESGFTEEEDNWLANFGDNPIEYFTQYHVRHAEVHRRYLAKRVAELPGEMANLREQSTSQTGDAKAKTEKRIVELTAKLKHYEAESKLWTKENYDKLSPREKSLHAKAFDANVGDPHYRELKEITYRDGDVERKMRVPKGDILHQFRQDVSTGKLPTVSWIVAPQKFSDHPSSAWYGAWYISEIMNILTHNPAVWKKTIFMLTYDENDGYFDHVPPFVVPHPKKPETGLVTPGIDAAVEFVEYAQDRKRKSAGQARESSIGLGYRVPLVIASPWSRGGAVCSQVFDHTSSLLFLEKFLSHKTGKKVEEPNITHWRRAICGDLTSSFQAPDADPVGKLDFLKHDEFVADIHCAQFKQLPGGFHALSKEEIEQIRRNPKESPVLPRQEPGTRRSAPLPYELVVDGALNKERDRFIVRLEAKNDVFGPKAAGSPFTVYAFTGSDKFTVRNYAVAAGQRLEDSWPLTDFVNGKYQLRVYGPNGFFREFIGDTNDAAAITRINYAGRKAAPGLTGEIELFLVNRGSEALSVEVHHHAYTIGNQQPKIAPGEQFESKILTENSHGWYDFSVKIGNTERRYAGRVETGQWGFSDPAMGRA